MREIHNQLHIIQRTLNAPKNQKNKFGGWNFRSCEDILEALKAVLPATATVTLSDEMVMIGERYYNKATATFHYSGESLSTTAFAREDVLKKGMDLAQLNGSISSYSRKYALQGLFCIDDAKHEAIEDIDSLDNGQTLRAVQEAIRKNDAKALADIDGKATSDSWHDAMNALSDDEYKWVQVTLGRQKG